MKTSNTNSLIEKIKEARANDYGSFMKVAEVTNALVEALEKGSNCHNLDEATRLGFFMICNKMARAVNGRLTRDTLLDIQGYASLILEHSPLIVEPTKENTNE